MKIGVISHGSPDYLIDIVTDGLIRLLGRQSLCLDYNVRGGWGGQYKHCLEGFKGPEPFDLYDADALIASTRSAAPAAEWIRKTGKSKVAIVDGEDYPTLHDIYRQAKVYFKREFPHGVGHPANVKPLSFAAIPEPFVERERTNPVFFRFHPTHPFRVEISNALTSLGYPSNPARAEKAEYNDGLLGSKIGISVRGGGWDTYRYWEVPYFGAMLMSQRTGIVIPNDFIPDQEAVFFSGVDEFRQKLRCMVSDHSRGAEIAANGRKACLERHLSIHRARTVLEALA